MSKKITKTTPTEKSKHPGGRPTKYTLELAEKICKAVATSTDSLAKICDGHSDFPAKATIYEWRFDYKEFSDLYAEAKRKQADLLAEEIAEICDSPRASLMEVNDARLKIDTRKWIACKLLPKVYGEKVQNEVTVTSHEKALEQLK